jgi:hypothetical protein
LIQSKDTFLAVVYDNGSWSIVSHDQSPKSIAELRKTADERGCRLVRLPYEAIYEIDHGRLDLSQAEDVVDG